MRILAAHDEQGNIKQIVISPADAPLGTVTAETGLLVTEVEAPEALSGVDLSDPERSRRQLAEVFEHLQDFRIEGEAKAKLIRNDSEDSEASY
jgi:hypothetical protein